MYIRNPIPPDQQSERQATVAALAEHVLGSAEEAREWLRQKHPLLGNLPPIEVAATDFGARQVERILHNIEYGLPV